MEKQPRRRRQTLRGVEAQAEDAEVEGAEAGGAAAATAVGKAAAPAGAPKRRKRRGPKPPRPPGRRCPGLRIPEALERELEDELRREPFRAFAAEAVGQLRSRRLAAAPPIAGTLADSDDPGEESIDPGEVQYGDEFGELELEAEDEMLSDVGALLIGAEGLLSYEAEGGLVASSPPDAVRRGGGLPKQRRAEAPRKRSREERRALRAAAEARLASGRRQRRRCCRVTPAKVRCCNRLARLQAPSGRGFLLAPLEPLGPGALCCYDWEAAREVWRQVDQGDVDVAERDRRADYPSMTGIVLEKPLLEVKAVGNRLLYARSETQLLACSAKYKEGGVRLKQFLLEPLMEPAIGLCPNPFDEGQIATVHETGLRIWSAKGPAVDKWTLQHPALAKLPEPLSSDFHEVEQRPLYAATWWRDPRQLLVAGTSVHLLDLRDQSLSVLGVASRDAYPLYEAVCTVDSHPWEEHQFVATVTEPVQVLIYDVRKDSGPLFRWPLPEKYCKDHRALHQPGHVVWGRMPGTGKTILGTPCRGSSDMALYAWEDPEAQDDGCRSSELCRLYPRTVAGSEGSGGGGRLRGSCLLPVEDSLALVCLRENGDLTCQWVQEPGAEPTGRQCFLPEGVGPSTSSSFGWKPKRASSPERARAAQERVDLGSLWLTSGSLRVALVLERLGLLAAPQVPPEPLVCPNTLESFLQAKKQALAATQRFRVPVKDGGMHRACATTGPAGQDEAQHPASLQPTAPASPIPIVDDDGGDAPEGGASSGGEAAALEAAGTEPQGEDGGDAPEGGAWSGGEGAALEAAGTEPHGEELVEPGPDPSSMQIVAAPGEELVELEAERDSMQIVAAPGEVACYDCNELVEPGAERNSMQIVAAPGEGLVDPGPDPNRLQMVVAPGQALVRDVVAEDKRVKDLVLHALHTGDCSALQQVPLSKRFRLVLEYFQVRLPSGWNPIKPVIPEEDDPWAERVNVAELCNVAFHVSVGTRKAQTHDNFAQWSAAERKSKSWDENVAGVTALARALANVGVVRRVDLSRREMTGLAEIDESYYASMRTPREPDAGDVARYSATRDVTSAEWIDIAAELAGDEDWEGDFDEVLHRIEEGEAAPDPPEAGADEDDAGPPKEPVLPVSLRVAEE